MSIYIQSVLQKSLKNYEQMYLATVKKVYSRPQVVKFVKLSLNLSINYNVHMITTCKPPKN